MYWYPNSEESQGFGNIVAVSVLATPFLVIGYLVSGSWWGAVVAFGVVAIGRALYRRTAFHNARMDRAWLHDGHSGTRPKNWSP